jgi:competence protein ComEA
MKQRLQLLVATALLLIGTLASALAQKQPPPAPLDLNTACLEQLTQLPGVGPVTAKAILDFREKSGPFRRVEDLLSIRGITDRRLKELRPYVTVLPKKKAGLPETGLDSLVRGTAGGDGDGHLVGNGQAVAFERHEFARVIGEHAEIGEAEIDQNLRADAAFVLQKALAGDVAIELPARVQANVRQLV